MTFHHHRTPHLAAVPPAARGLPGPTPRAVLRERLHDEIEARIALLDALDGDPDLEIGADAEPSLCGLGSHEPAGDFPGYPVWGGPCGGDMVDIEYDEADGPEGDDEREADPADDGIADEGGVFEQCGEVFFGSADELDTLSGAPLTSRQRRAVLQQLREAV